MKLRNVSIMAVIAMLVTLGGCNRSETKAKTEEPVKKQLVGFAISYTGNDFMQALAENVKQGFINKGYDCEVAVADGDATKQIEQIENFTTMGANMIVVMAVDPTGLTDVCKRARQKGCKVVAFTTDVGEQDCYVGSASEEEIGEDVAKIGSNWINKTFPNEDEVEVAIFGYTGTPEAALRTNGLKKITEFNSKVKVLYIEPKSNTLDAAQQSAENLFQTNKNIRAIICYNSGMCNGVNAYVMSTGSAVTDKAHFGTFGSDYTEEVAANLRASVKNESVVRGIISLGTMAEIVSQLVEPCDALLKGVSVPAKITGKNTFVTADNVDKL